MAWSALFLHCYSHCFLLTNVAQTSVGIYCIAVSVSVIVSVSVGVYVSIGVSERVSDSVIVVCF